jgi:hypothetical protein
MTQAGRNGFKVPGEALDLTVPKSENSTSKTRPTIALAQSAMEKRIWSNG